MLNTEDQRQMSRDVSSVDVSIAMRNYLAEIYRIKQGDSWVSTTALADVLDVSGPATVRMVRRMQEKGLAEHQSYKGVLLTELGKREALLVIRRYRLIERFLVDILQFEWHDTYPEANVLEKRINQRIEDRIDQILGHPTTCPHGAPIPTREGVLPAINDRPLTDLALNDRGAISRVKERSPEKLSYLAKIGLTPRTPFQLINRAPFNGPLRLKIGKNEQVISMELATHIWVFLDEA